MDDSATRLKVCPVCGADQFVNESVLWPELIEQWELAPDEVAYINLQQGFCCSSCKNNLRTMTLAAAVTGAFGFSGTFEDFCRDHQGVRQLTVVEINAAKNLSRFLQTLPKHAIHSFPELDMQEMSLADSSIDVIIHSDTLEHVADSKAALRECWRVLRPAGHLFYTIPIRHRPLDPNATRITTELPRDAGSETRGLRCTNRNTGAQIFGAKFSMQVSEK